MTATVFVPNQGQKLASEKFFSFLFSPEKEMGITGPGGVGKTALMGYMTDKVMPEYLNACKMVGIAPKYETVFWTATTNKAAEVLSRAANRPTTTLASLLSLKVSENTETGVTKLTKTNGWKIIEKAIIFVDESSMIDIDLYNLLHEATLNCKIVYVGDHCQLAPVKETISMVYAGGINHVELTEQMRTNDPDLQALNAQLRQTVETGLFQPIQIKPGVIDWLSDAEMGAAIDSTFLTQNKAARILCYTNKRVGEYNDDIRILRQLPPQYTVGEVLVNNSAVRLSGTMFSIEEEVTVNRVNPTIFEMEVGVWDNEPLIVPYQFADITNTLGMTFRDVRLPVDREQFAGMLRWLGNRKMWKELFDMKKALLDLRQRDASTVHKAQGSTLDTVFIDAGNISRATDKSQVARMLYVATSRARKRVVFYGTLNAKYGGLVR